MATGGWTAPRRVGAAVAVAAAAVTHLVLQAGMMLGWSGWDLSSFRNYYHSDQLAYLSIVTDVSQGVPASVEPFTLTGSIYYPRAYYVLIGWLAQLTSAHPATVWTLGGLAAQVGLVIAVGTTCVLLTRRWWTGLLGFVPFVLGTGSWLRDRDSWMTTLDSHAVLWGPFGVLYTLNGESVALCLGAVALLVLLLAAAGRLPRRWAWPAAVAACGTVGALANVQTYSFLTCAFVLAGCAAAVGLVRRRSRVAVAATGALLLGVVLVGPAVGGISPLAALAFGFLPTLPGLLALARELRWRPLWCAAAAVVGAAPQVLATVLGLAGGDDFLVYREASSKDLGVPLGQGLLAAVWVVPAILVVLWLGAVLRSTVMTGVVLGAVVVWAYLSVNDVWGANQEPYRFWLDTYLVVTVLLVPLLAWAAAAALDRRAPVDGARVRPVRPVRPARPLVVAGVVVATTVAGVSVGDFPNFRRTVDSWGYIPLVSPRYETAADLASTADGLVMVDPCLDPLLVKVAWGGPLLWYNRGLAWPDGVEDVHRVLADRESGVVDPVRAERLGLRWVLVDPSCSVDIRSGMDGELVEAREYTDDGTTVSGSVELWRLAG